MDEEEQELVSNRHGQLVWRGGGVITREGDPERIKIHAEMLMRLNGSGVAPKLLSFQPGVSQEEEVKGIVLRSAPISTEKKLELILEALKRVHVKSELDEPFETCIFKRFEKTLRGDKWLKEHFPKVGEIVYLHGACNFTNALYVDGKVFLIDFCDSYPGPKECDLGSLFFFECFEYSTLKEVCSVFSYDLKPTLFFAILYGINQLRKNRDKKIKHLVEIRVSHLKQQYLEIE